MRNKVVLHFLSGELTKGETNDFFPNKDFFHLACKDSGETLEIDLFDLKAIYFVKTFEGNPDYNERHDVERAGFGKKIQVQFKDSESIIGYTQGFSPNRPGFFLFPADASSNNDRIFIVNSSTQEIGFI
ncbi:MAG: hypothetical protein IME96_05600 [Proteobacteria bacterium]|nr:hypothetical protein [Pseudomonadota bacterium]